MIRLGHSLHPGARFTQVQNGSEDRTGLDANQTSVIYLPTSAGTTVGLPLVFTGTLSIDWGDGVSEDVTQSGWIEHIYDQPGVYTAIFTGAVSQIWQPDPPGTRLETLVRVVGWNSTLERISLRGAAILAEVPRSLPDTVTSLAECFRDCASLNDHVISGWDVGNVTDMAGMFRDTVNFDRDLSGWDVAHFSGAPVDFATGSALQEAHMPPWPVPAPVLSELSEVMTSGVLGIGLTASEAGEVIWDFHSSLTPPAAGQGDIASGSFTATEGANSTTLGLSAHRGAIGHVHLRLGASNILSTAQISLPASYDTDQVAVVYEPGADATTVGLPLQVSGDVQVDWGDGTIETVSASGWIEHIYPVAGNYTAVFTGPMTRIWHSVTPTGQMDHLTRVLAWNEGLVHIWLCSAARLIEVPASLPVSVTSLNEAFKECVSLNDPNIANWDVSNVTDMTETFKTAHAFNQPIGVWNTANCQNMQRMFGEAHAFNQDLPWDTSNVLDMADMFRDAAAFNGDISGFDTSGLTGLKMQNIFLGAAAFNGDISTWDVSGLTSLRYVFNGASSFNGDISGWNTSAVTDMVKMFMNASLFSQDLSGWDVSLIPAEPNSFGLGSGMTTAQYPVWGTDGAGGGTDSNVAQDLGPLSGWAPSNGTISGDTLTAAARNSTVAVTARTEVNVLAPGSYTLRFEASAENLTGEQRIHAKLLLLGTSPSPFGAHFDLEDGSIHRDNGPCRMSDIGGGSWVCEMDFDIASDGTGYLDIGPNETTYNVFRLLNPAGDEAITVKNAKILIRSTV